MSDAAEASKRFDATMAVERLCATFEHVRYVSPTDAEKLIEALRSAWEDGIRKAANVVEKRRQKVLRNPVDPSWTEHFAELQT